MGKDFSRRIKELRTKLWDSAKENRVKKEKGSLTFDKLYINNRAYVWSQEKGERVPLATKNSKARMWPITRYRSENKNNTTEPERKKYRQQGTAS